MQNIKGYGTFKKIETLSKGWLGDKKYFIETADGRRLLLRISDISVYDCKRAEFDKLKRLAELDVPTSRPVDFGVFDNGKSVYQLQTWIDGEDAEVVLPRLTDTEQYALGLKAGELLRKIHSIPAPSGIAEWSERYFSVIEERINAYCLEGAPFEGSEIILAYLKNNRELLKGRPQCFLHGDYHEGNLMVANDGQLYVIDWLDEGFGNNGDPWYDFKAFGENGNVHFSTGLVRGYFGGDPPQVFWDVLTYYTVTAALTSIVWMKYHRPEELPENLLWNVNNAQFICNGQSPLMKWYLKDFYVQYVDGVLLKLKAPFDLSFLVRYGKVFKVFDDQDSGNLCFGVEQANKRYFVKFAGASTELYKGNPADSIARLKAAVPIYRDLAHPNLIRFFKAEELGGGFAVSFEWVDAVCAQKMYSADHKIFNELPFEIKQHIFADIMEFHAHVAAKGYVAIDFYDGSIMWDAENERTIICDIDFYQKSPYVGRMGLWGSSRFVSPEEHTDGAVIDEVTNVYTMGATAFCLFADSDHSPEKWPLTPELYIVVKKATSDDKSKRQQSIRQLIVEWEAAKRASRTA